MNTSNIYDQENINVNILDIYKKALADPDSDAPDILFKNCVNSDMTSTENQFLLAECYLHGWNLPIDKRNNRDELQLYEDGKKAAILYYSASSQGEYAAQKQFNEMAARFYFDGDKIRGDKIQEDGTVCFSIHGKFTKTAEGLSCPVWDMKEKSESFLLWNTNKIAPFVSKMLTTFEDIYLETFDNTHSHPLTSDNPPDEAPSWSDLNKIREETKFQNTGYQSYTNKELEEMISQGNYFAECEYGVRRLYNHVSSEEEIAFIEAEYYLQRSLLHGNPAAACYLADLFSMRSDTERYRRYLAYAASKGFACALRNYSTFFNIESQVILLDSIVEYGGNNEFSDPIAAEWLAERINDNDTDRILHLLEIAAKSSLLASSTTLARYHYKLLKDGYSSADAKKIYDYIQPYLTYKKGETVQLYSELDEKDFSSYSHKLAPYSYKPFRYYQDSVYEENYPFILFLLAYCYEHGYGVNQSTTQAKEYYQKSYTLGYTAAKAEYDRLDKHCYVATCVYGSYDCPQVWTLRRYRDNYLAKSIFGRAFIRTYYAISPTLVKWFGNTNSFKKLWKPILDQMVLRLNEKGIENTPYRDKD